MEADVQERDLVMSYISDEINAVLAYDGSDDIEAIGACLVAFLKVSLHYHNGHAPVLMSEQVWNDCVNARILCEGVLRNKFEGSGAYVLAQEEWKLQLKLHSMSVSVSE